MKGLLVTSAQQVLWFEDLGRDNVSLVGGKNASLGEMVRTLENEGVRILPSFATTADAYWRYIEANGLKAAIASALADLAVGAAPLANVGAAIRDAILRGEWPADTAEAIRVAYRELCQRANKADADVAVRSSATAADLSDASFVGQQETYLNIRGEADLLDACRRCCASPFTDRTISYRQVKKFDHMKVALAVASDGLGALRRLKDADAKSAIAGLTASYVDKTEYFVDRLARGLARIAAVFHPNPVIVRMSDFKTNEYANLIGGAEFEPKDENPMLGFRGASRYYSPRYREGFALECRAIRRLREEMGFDNVIVMIPFCRSTREADRVLAVMAENGLRRAEKILEVYVMCEIPSNVILAKAFAERFDGFSIGGNDFTQLTLGVGRDSAELAELFDEQDAAVKWMI